MNELPPLTPETYWALARKEMEDRMRTYGNEAVTNEAKPSNPVQQFYQTTPVGSFLTGVTRRIPEMVATGIMPGKSAMLEPDQGKLDNWSNLASIASSYSFAGMAAPRNKDSILGYGGNNLLRYLESKNIIPVKSQYPNAERWGGMLGLPGGLGKSATDNAYSYINTLSRIFGNALYDSLSNYMKPKQDTERYEHRISEIPNNSR